MGWSEKASRKRRKASRQGKGAPMVPISSKKIRAYRARVEYQKNEAVRIKKLIKLVANSHFFPASDTSRVVLALTCHFSRKK